MKITIEGSKQDIECVLKEIFGKQPEKEVGDNPPAQMAYVGYKGNAETACSEYTTVRCESPHTIHEGQEQFLKCTLNV